MAETAPPLRSLVDADAPAFLQPGDHPAILRSLCRQSGQPAPESTGQYVRCVLESLALRYRRVISQLADCAGQKIEAIHIVGGGSQNTLLNQMTADATGLPVVAGPVEATVLGNALVQMITLGELKDLREARSLVASMDGVHVYSPGNGEAWDKASRRFE